MGSSRIRERLLPGRAARLFDTGIRGPGCANLGGSSTLIGTVPISFYTVMLVYARSLGYSYSI